MTEALSELRPFELESCADVIISRSVHHCAGILAERDGLLIRAFNQNAWVVTDHEVPANHDVLCLRSSVHLDAGNLMRICLNDIVADDIM